MVATMEPVQETPEEAVKDATGKSLAAMNVVSPPAPKDSSVDENEEDDDYEDDNDFEPFETSKKDFYQNESLDSKTQLAVDLPNSNDFTEARSQYTHM